MRSEAIALAPYLAGPALFVLLLATVPVPEQPDLGVRRRGPAIACPEARLEQSGPCELQRNEPFLRYTCAPASILDSDWMAEVRLVVPPHPEACHYFLRMLDGPSPARFADMPASEVPPHPTLTCRSDETGETCLLSAKPWRPYVFLGAVERGGVSADAAAPVELFFFRGSRLNARLSAIVVFLLEAIATGFLAWLLYRNRPGGPAGGFAPIRHRLRTAALVGAAAGGLTGLFISARPSDFGGYDLPSLDRVLLLQPVWWGLGAIVLVAAELARGRAGAPQRGLATRWVVVAACALAISAAANAMRDSFYGPAWGGILYVPRHNLCLIVALLGVHVFGADRPAGDIGNVRLVLFGRLVAAEMVQTAVSFGLAPFVKALSTGGLVTGYYKPLGAVALLVCTMPWVGALAFVATLGEDRPQWVRELAQACRDALALPPSAARSRLLLRLVPSMLHKEGEIARSPEFIAPLAGLLRLVLEGVDASEADFTAIARAEGLEASELRDRIDHLRALLARAEQLDAGLPEVSAPVVFVGAGGATLGEVRVAVRAAVLPTPDELPELDLRVNGVPHPLAPRTLDVTAAAVRAVLARLVDESGGRRLRSRRVRIDLVPPEGALAWRGRSHELATLLAVSSLTQPAANTWLATGAVEPDGTVLEVEALEAKAAILATHPHALFLVPAGGTGLQPPAGTRLVRVSNFDEARDALLGRRPAPAPPPLGEPS